MNRLPIVMILLFLLISCNGGRNRFNVDVSSVHVPDVVIHRYDRDLFRVDPNRLRDELELLKPQYPFFLDADLGDTMKLLAMRDYLENERNRMFAHACDSVFPDLSALEPVLTGLFRHLLHYYPELKAPRVYSFVSAGDYQFPVQWADSVLLVGLDCYLGKDFPVYKADQVPLYRMERANPAYLPSDVANAFFSGIYRGGFSGNTLLENMLAAGKRILFIEAMLPEEPDYLKIGYTKEQYDWASDNEEHIWAAIIGNGLLYSTGGQTIRSFLSDGPFTAEFSQESPPRLGEYIGWRILRMYMSRNSGLTLQHVMEEQDAQKILSGSKYKPEK